MTLPPRPDSDAAAEALLSAVVVRVAECESLGIDARPLHALIQTARKDLRANDPGAAMALLQRADSLLHEARQLHRDSYNEISEAGGLVKGAQRRGVDVRMLLGRLMNAKSAFSRAEYSQALEIARQVRADVKVL